MKFNAVRTACIGVKDKKRPTGLSVDANGNMYVADMMKGRVQKIPPLQIESLFIPSASGTYTAVILENNGCTSRLTLMRVCILHK